MEKKKYNAPVIISENIEIGIFGQYNSNGPIGNGPGGHHGHGNWHFPGFGHNHGHK